MDTNQQPPSPLLPSDVEDLLIDMHADGQEPPAALVDEWCRRHPECESRIRGTVASLVQFVAEHPSAIAQWRIVRTLGGVTSRGRPLFLIAEDTREA